MTVVGADLRLAITQQYVEAAAAQRRLVTAREQASNARDALRAALVRVQAGRASPIEQQRADVLRRRPPKTPYPPRIGILMPAARASLTVVYPIFRGRDPARLPLAEQAIAVSCHPSVNGMAKKSRHDAQGTEQEATAAI